MSHRNEEFCASCAEILNRYPGFHEGLRTWFLALRVEHPEAHVSSAGRGKIDQEVAFQRGASKAHYGESSHNYNCALDLFELRDGEAVWDKDWFQKVVAPELYPALKWYGAPGSIFWELPHIEASNWRELRSEGLVHLVE